MDVSTVVLLKGAWYALEQCGILLRDARVLFHAKAYASAVALAMVGREELGKFRMLLEESSKAEATGNLPTVEAIQTACEDHVDKQRRAMLSLTFTPQGPSEFGKAIEATIRHKPHDPEYQEAEKVIQAALKSLAKRAPDERHAARIQALYVDLQDSGSDWSRPSEMPPDKCKKFLNDAANDYTGQRKRMSLESLRALGDMKLADALEAWPQRPELLEPAWAEF